MVPRERRHDILQNLRTNGYMSVEDLARQLYVSEPTIRRDLTALEQEGSIRRTHGGASYVSPDSLIWSIALRRKINLSEKRRIGLAAARLVGDGARLFIDSTSTSIFLAQAIASRRELSVVTASFPIAQLLAEAPDALVEMPSGRFDAEAALLDVPDGDPLISHRHADLFFLSSAGLDAELGVTSRVREELGYKKSLRANADRTVLLMDHSKVGVRSYFKLFELEQIDVAVVDEPVDDELAEALDAADVELIIAD